jgi:hypothetical protein
VLPPKGAFMTPPTLLIACHNREQLVAKICAECERAQKRSTKCENAKKVKHLSEEDPKASKIWSRWIQGELQAQI